MRWSGRVKKEMLEKVREEINEDQQSYFIRKKMKVYEDELRKMGDETLSDAASYEKKIEALDINGVKA